MKRLDETQTELIDEFVREGRTSLVSEVIPHICADYGVRCPSFRQYLTIVLVLTQ